MNVAAAAARPDEGEGVHAYPARGLVVVPPAEAAEAAEDAAVVDERSWKPPKPGGSSWGLPPPTDMLIASQKPFERCELSSA